MDEATFLNVLKMTVENHGCSIVDFDLENHVVNLDGPDEAVNACALGHRQTCRRITANLPTFVHAYRQRLPPLLASGAAGKSKTIGSMFCYA